MAFLSNLQFLLTITHVFHASSSFMLIAYLPKRLFRSSFRSISSMADDLIDYSSLTDLQQRMVHFVQQSSHHCQLAVSIAGGGSHFLSALASTPGASKILLQGTLTYDRESYRQLVQRDLHVDFKYASQEAALYASQAAFQQALQLTAAGDVAFGHDPLANMSNSIGLACASALRPLEDGSSQAFVAVVRHDGPPVELKATLKAERTRFQQDVFVSHCILTCLEHALYENDVDLPSLQENTPEFQTTQGDTIRLSVPKQILCHDNKDAILNWAAERILSGRDTAVVVLPITCNQERRFRVLSNFVIPPNSLILPGSFNPPHDGHIALARAALKAANCDIVWFEISLTNADKPPLSAEQVAHRLKLFLSFPEMPPRWGIILTNAPLFRQKVKVLCPHHISRTYSSQHTPLYFVVGTDTLLRLVDPKYYNNSQDEMIRTVSQMPCRFVVGGRLEQKTDNPRFLTGQDAVDGLPRDVQEKFILLTNFRVDISSTELRQRSRKQ